MLFCPRFDELDKFGVTAEDISANNKTANLTALFEFQAQRARQYYQQAFQLLPEIDRYPQRSGLIMAETYLKTLEEIEKSGFNVIERRVRLTPVRKLWFAWKMARHEKRRYNKLKKLEKLNPSEES